ncbi:GNAT family N-acetyltransferase [Streptomyces sp. NBC_01176]|nr:GNAT family N-acetyltransferase [Streptomyces sp. NBC_01176]
MTDDERDRPTVHALLADGTTVCIRSARPGDHEQLRGLYEEMSPENIRLRFFAASRRSADLAADRAAAPARPGYRALLAETHGRVIGLAEYETVDDPETAEMSIAVADGLHHRGVGTLLVEHLVSAARADDVTTFTADALSENHEVLRLFTDLGLRAGRRFEGPEVRCTIALGEDDTYLAAVEARGRAAAELLACYGIPQLPWAWAETEDDAVIAAERLRGADGRVVMKAHWPGLVHKTEQHAIHLDLEGDAQVRAAFRDFEARFAGLMTGVVVQPLAARGTELFAGVTQDDVFGPLVLFGLGGTATEVLSDHAARLAPLTDHDVHDLITAPRCAPLLLGTHGGRPADLQGLEQLLLRLSRMASDLPQLAEADFNPVLATPAAVTVLDARVRLLPRRAQDPYLRRLR